MDGLVGLSQVHHNGLDDPPPKDQAGEEICKGVWASPHTIVQGEVGVIVPHGRVAHDSCPRGQAVWLEDGETGDVVDHTVPSRHLALCQLPYLPLVNSLPHFCHIVREGPSMYHVSLYRALHLESLLCIAGHLIDTRFPRISSSYHTR